MPSEPPDIETTRFFMVDADKLQDPFPDFAYFREQKPVFWYEPMRMWFVFRFDDVDALLRDHRLSSKRMPYFFSTVPPEKLEGLRWIVEYCDRWLVNRDGEDHRTVRKLFHAGFTPRVIGALRQSMQRSAEALLDRVEPAGRMDGAQQLAYPLSLTIISDLIGVGDEERANLTRWADDLSAFFNDVPVTTQACDAVSGTLREMVDHLRREIAERRARPHDDYLGQLVRVEDEGHMLDDTDIIANAILLLAAGHIPARAAIGHALSLILSHRDQLELLRADPALLSPAVEEVLRFEPSTPLLVRIAAEDLDWNGHTFRKGQFVQLCVASANRDRRHFPDGDRFNITRAPGKLLTFASGPHFCLGALLAQQQTEVAVEAVIRRFPGIALDPAQPSRWIRTPMYRGPVSLPLRW
jgi:cytochrome P450